MADLASCSEPVETHGGVFFPCVREHGHDGEHSTGRCDARYQHAGGTFACTLHRGHPGSHRSWVEDADVDREERDASVSALDEWREWRV